MFICSQLAFGFPGVTFQLWKFYIISTNRCHISKIYRYIYTHSSLQLQEACMSLRIYLLADSLHWLLNSVMYSKKSCKQYWLHKKLKLSSVGCIVHQKHFLKYWEWCAGVSGSSVLPICCYCGRPVAPAPLRGCRWSSSVLDSLASRELPS